MFSDVLIVLSEIPTQQRDLLKDPSFYESYVNKKMSEHIKVKLKKRRLCFLNYSNISRLRYKKIIVLQYLDIDKNDINQYKGYLRKVYSFYKLLKQIEVDESAFNEVEDESMKDRLLHYNDYLPTNAEKPLSYLNEEKFNDYLNTFECEFMSYIYKFISYREKNDLENLIANIIDNIDINGQTHIVMNLGKTKYREALLTLIPDKGIPFQAYNDDETGGYQFKPHQLLQDILFKDLYFNYLSEQDSTIDELRKVAKQHNIPDPGFKIHVKNYYIASICKKFNTRFLILGDTGVGKTYFVNSIISEPEKQKYIEINCATLSDELFRSELFGHEKGAFTGANKEKDGFLTKYKDGIVFLDEVGELSLKNQAKILTFLDKKAYTPVGSVDELKSNAYIIFATNRNLKEMCENKTFRWDLYYRIAKIVITIPLFNELALSKKELFIHEIEKKCNTELWKESLTGDEIKFSSNIIVKKSRYLSKNLGTDAISFIMNDYHWPGNLREIYNTVLKSFMFSQGNEISRDKLQLYLDIAVNKPPLDPFNMQYRDIEGKNARALIKKIQYQIASLALENNDGVKAAAARAIGLLSQTFGNWLKDIEQE